MQGEQPSSVLTRRYVWMVLALALFTALFAISMALGIGKAEAQAAGPYTKLSELTVRPAGTALL